MKRWLKFAEAAALLGVTEGTIKRWINSPALRETLLAVRHGKQWRIPLPDYETTWEMETRHRLKEAGIHLTSSLEQALHRESKRFDRCSIESCRFWMAAQSQLLEKEQITDEDIGAVTSLWNAACAILKEKPRGTETNKLKSAFPELMRTRGYSEQEVCAIMQYWPRDIHFKIVRDAYTWKLLEELRHKLDVTQAAKVCKRHAKKQTAENLRPLLHDGIIAHINDTRERLPPNTVTAHEPDDIRRVTEADRNFQCYGANPRRVTQGRDAQGRTFVHIEGGGIPFLDMRNPQEGLPLRTFRRRYPLRKSPQRAIIAAVTGALVSIPGACDSTGAGKTPVRGSRESDERDFS